MSYFCRGGVEKGEGHAMRAGEILPLPLSLGPRTLKDADTHQWPRITLVTPVYNGERHLEETILSILHQGYPNLEYFIEDGGSTDGTLEIIRKYERQLSGWTSEPDNGMYNALNRGFAHATGEIMGWLNASDKLHTSGLFVVGGIFSALPDVEWITGRATNFNEDGMTIAVHENRRWSRYRFLAGANRYIQQESTYWRRRLWERSGGYLDDSGRCGAVGDFELWVRFFRSARLYSTNALIGGYRLHSDSSSLQDMDRWHRIHDQIVEQELNVTPWGRWLKLFRRISASAQRIPILRKVWRLLVMKGLIRLPGPDWPPVIKFRRDKWTVRWER
jgi:glycosyltransferase involved in cell wall biosynthesis